MKKLTTIAAAVALLAACNNPQVPTDYTQSNELPKIYPDYTEVTIPVNMAPLSFELDEAADELVARYAVDGQEIVCGGDKAQPGVDDWHLLADKAKGRAISVDVYARHDEQWTRYKPFNIYVSTDSIDPYLSYRLISPSYITYEELTISQRCLESYDESVIYDNQLCSFEKTGQCINCHNYQQYNPDRMQFHARQFNGGTVITYDGKVRKINMRNDSILSAGVYPTWHPWLKLIVYSTNTTHQSFHTTDLNKVEVFDGNSDLIAYDVENNEVTNIENAPDELEVFPFWAPDGKTLYYCSAHFVHNDSVSPDIDVLNNAVEIKYNIYRKSFDPDTRRFGPRELVFDAAALDKSATFPRVSPDGRFLMFTLGQYGVFHIWHHDADLWMLDLSNNENTDSTKSNLSPLSPVASLPNRSLLAIASHLLPLKELNSDDTESYHSWSSNGRWVVFSSRRNDGNYTRPFFAHIDKDGRGTKPFELPCADPDFHRQYMKCYNIPEFMRGPVTIKPQTYADVLKTEGEPVKYVQQLR